MFSNAPHQICLSPLVEGLDTNFCIHMFTTVPDLFNCEKGDRKMNDDCMKHGAFGWFELMTTDAEGAKKFYAELFGWEYDTMPTGNCAPYTVVKVGGEAVAGIMVLPEECKGMPPSWGIYITVDNVDATVSSVVSLGGKVLRPAFDIPEVGRFCVLQDPQGAVLMAMTYLKK
jgi:predicted enzyme related to lactoylglutathione lyase